VRLVLLDEINIALLCEYLPVDEVLAGLRTRVPGQHVILTGRGAPRELVEFADLVTEMREVKHYHARGVPARRGIEF
jgi:cob(I)alamin adenosyltransferase